MNSGVTQTFTASPSGGTGSYSYNWSLSSSTNCTTSSSASSSYSVTCTNSGSSQISRTVNVTITSGSQTKSASTNLYINPSTLTVNVTSYSDSVENDYLGNIQWETVGSIRETGVYISYKSDKSDATKIIAPLNRFNKYAAILAPKYCLGSLMYARAYIIGTNGVTKYSDWKNISLAEYCAVSASAKSTDIPLYDQKEESPADAITKAISTTGCSTAPYLGSLSCSTSKSTSSSLSSGATKWHKVYASSLGTLTTTLTGPSGTDFDLYVYNSCGSSWICRPYTSSSNETCTINASAGSYYYLGVNSYSGSGNYSLNSSLACANVCSNTSQTCSDAILPFDIREVDLAGLGWSGIKFFTIGSCLDDGWLTVWCAFDVGSTAVIIVPGTEITGADFAAIGTKLAKLAKSNKLLVEIGTTTKPSQTVRKIELTVNGIKYSVAGSKITRGVELGIMQVDFIVGEIRTSFKYLSEWLLKYGDTAITRLKGLGATNYMLEVVVKKGGNLDLTYRVTKRADVVGVVWLEEGTSEWGWKHIVLGNHHTDIQKVFGLTNSDAAVKDLINEAAKSGIRSSTDAYKITIKKYSPYYGKDYYLRVINKDLSDTAIKTAYPSPIP